MTKHILQNTVTEDISIYQALRLFGLHNGLRILIVNDQNNNFIGILTDPDIRRGLLKGFKLEDSISPIVNRNPITAHPDASKEELLMLASKHNIQEILIQDSSKQIIDIVSISSLIKPIFHSNPIVIMAGGLGTRLRPLTNTLPKPMLKIGNKPILQIILERFKQQGFRNIILCVNYKSHIIEDYFGDGSSFGLNITYIKEKKQLGTAGALSLISNLNEDFFVMNGDILTDIDFFQMLQFHKKHNADATMGIREYISQIPYGVVNTQEHSILSIDEKPTLSFNVNAGIYILSPHILKLIPQNEFFDMPSLFGSTLTNSRYNIIAYLVDGYWIDIGHKEEYDRANSEMKIKG